MEHGDPISYLALGKGADVISSDGERIGEVEQVLGDESTGIFDGVIIDTRLGPGGIRFVDAPQVDECRENAVILSISTAEAERLPEPSANPSVLEHHGVEDVEGDLKGKLRRAWDLISGR